MKYNCFSLNSQNIISLSCVTSYRNTGVKSQHHKFIVRKVNLPRGSPLRGHGTGRLTLISRRNEACRPDLTLNLEYEPEYSENDSERIDLSLFRAIFWLAVPISFRPCPFISSATHGSTAPRSFTVPLEVPERPLTLLPNAKSSTVVHIFIRTGLPNLVLHIRHTISTDNVASSAL
jgi:hypothetical protein